VRILAFARDWHAAGIIPFKERNPKTGRMHWPSRFRLNPVTPVVSAGATKGLKGDVPLVALSEVEEALAVLRDWQAISEAGCSSQEWEALLKRRDAVLAGAPAPEVAP
jgi:hypothetical protein